MTNELLIAGTVIALVLLSGFAIWWFKTKSLRGYKNQLKHLNEGWVRKLVASGFFKKQTTPQNHGHFNLGSWVTYEYQGSLFGCEVSTGPLKLRPYHNKYILLNISVLPRDLQLFIQQIQKVGDGDLVCVLAEQELPPAFEVSDADQIPRYTLAVQLDSRSRTSTYIYISIQSIGEEVIKQLI